MTCLVLAVIAIWTVIARLNILPAPFGLIGAVTIVVLAIAVTRLIVARIGRIRRTRRFQEEWLNREWAEGTWVAVSFRKEPQLDPATTTLDQQQLATFLRPRSPYPYCLLCLTTELGISEQAAGEAARGLAQSWEFSVGSSVCYGCRHWQFTVVCMQYRAPSEPV